MSKNCVLYDIQGNCLAKFTPNQPFKIGNIQHEARIEADKVIRLFTFVESDTRMVSHTQAITALANELIQRKKDMETLENDIAISTQKLENGEGNNEVSLNMGRMMMLKGQHKKRIAELEKATTLPVTYERIRKNRSVQLPLGVFNKLSWFKKPVMWCTQIEEKFDNEITKITEEMPNKVLLHGKLYAVGGYCGADTSAKRTVERYDTDEGKWTNVASTSSDHIYPGVGTIDGQMYVCGSGEINSSEVERFDPKAKKWFPVKPMISNRGYCSAAVVDGLLYVTGGSDGTNTLKTAERYDPKEDKWTEIAPMNTPRKRHDCTVLNAQVYAVGGFDGKNFLSSVERYDPVHDKWTNIAPMSSKRQYHGVTMVFGKVYAAGGHDGKQCLKSVEQYNPATNKWTAVKDMNCKRNYVGLGSLGGKMYAAGGYDDNYALATVEEYEPGKNTWNMIQSLNMKRGYLKIAVIPLT